MQGGGRERFLVAGERVDQSADEGGVDVADVFEQFGHGPPLVQEDPFVAAGGGQRNGRRRVA